MKQETRSGYLLKNTIIFTVGNLGTRLIGFFLVPLYTYQLSTSQYGVVDLINTIATMIGPILILNINESVMRFSLDEDADRFKIISIGTTIYITALMSGLIVFEFSEHYEPLMGYGIYTYLLTLGYAGHLLFFGYLRGREKLVQFAIGNIITSLSIALLNIIFLLRMKWGAEGYLGAYIVSYGIAICYALCTGSVFSDLKHYSFDKVLFVKMIKYSLPLIPNTFMWWIINSSDRLMVTSMIGSSANGIYAISYKIPSLLQTFIAIFSVAWSYSAIREINSPDKAEYSNQVYKCLNAMAVIIGITMMLIMKPFLYIYVEKSYFEAWRYTPFLIVGFVFLSLASFLGTTYQVYKDSKGMLFSSLFAAITNLILNFVLIPIIGVSGAAIATCVSYFIVFIYRVYDTRKYIKMNVFSINNNFGLVMLVLSACCMFLDSMIGIRLIAFVLFISLIYYYKIWSQIIKTLFISFKSKRKQKGDY